MNTSKEQGVKRAKTTRNFWKDTKVFSIQKIVKNPWCVCVSLIPPPPSSSSFTYLLGFFSDNIFDAFQANFAAWEPGHGRFPFRHPWKLYLKVGTLARECAYRIEALNGCLNADIQV
jgi:hypothetical protein